MRPHVLSRMCRSPAPVTQRYSFLTCDPFDYFEVLADGSDWLAPLPKESRAPLRDLRPSYLRFKQAPPACRAMTNCSSRNVSPSAGDRRVPTPALGCTTLLAIDQSRGSALIISRVSGNRASPHAAPRRVLAAASRQRLETEEPMSRRCPTSRGCPSVNCRCDQCWPWRGFPATSRPRLPRGDPASNRVHSRRRYLPSEHCPAATVTGVRCRTPYLAGAP